MERLQVESKIAEAIHRLPRGSLLFINDFFDYGNVESVKKALFRLKQKKVLVSLSHGVYLYPKFDEELGLLFPSTEEIAESIARRDKARLAPTGVYALHRLALTTQVPMKVVYLTDGAARCIKVGARVIVFKRTTPKNLLAKGRISALVIQALKTIGQKNTDEATKKKINDLLRQENPDYIVHDARLSPAWISRILMQGIGK